ncbi:MAG: hypothetical protein CBC42_03855 [Betaproteobacteria bacterium TMED82]|nr:MAG: hypothetical protein CBC42_03855 [Betaproteobacteria bacterium TMED82]|tara:strand:+ start:10218 stop:11294 length:1077 start_codon:yes stop_codon:yes gene_type:complete
MNISNINHTISSKKNCKKIMSNGSKSFFAASRLFPKRLRYPATVIYAYCRLADDLVDFGGGYKAIIDLKRRLKLIYAGTPLDLGVDIEFSKIVLKYNIPKKLPEALIEGFQWDVEGRTYETINDLSDYAARVAGSVGAMIAALIGVNNAGVLRSACQMGVAMQLTNIARDIGEDAKNGRLYIPKEWLRQSGLLPEVWLKQPKFCKEISSITERLLFTAEQCYRNATPDLYRLPRDCRASLFSARYIYSEIGQNIKQNGYNSVDKRAFVPLRRKIELIMKSFHGNLVPRFLISLETRHVFNLTASTEFLIESMLNNRNNKRCCTQPLSFFERLGWVIDLFVRLAEKDRYELIDSRHPPR